MKFKTKGFITKISEVETLPNGAKKLSYEINQETQYDNLLTLEIYKSNEHSEHADNFVKYNKVGDRVQVEFAVRQREYEGKVYTNLSHWSIDKLVNEENAIQGQAQEKQVNDDLPF